MAVNDRKSKGRTEDTLKESEQRFRLLSELTNEGIVLHNKGRIVFANDQYYQMCGYKPEELDGINFVEKTLTPESVKIAKRKIAEGSTGSYEAIKKTKDGREFPVEIHVGITNYNGEQVRAAVIRDLSAQKKAEKVLRASEEKYRMLFNEMISGFALREIIFDDQGKPVDARILDVNPAYEQITGLKKEKVIGKTVLEVLPETESYWFENFAKVSSTGKPIQFENYHQGLDKHFFVSAFKFKENQVAIHFMDITDRKKAEIKLKNARKDLKKRVEKRTTELAKINEQMRQEIEQRKLAEEALGESELKYRTFFDVSSDAIFLETTDGRILDCNAAACDMLGYTKKELTKLKVADIVPRDIAKTLPDIIKKQLSTGGIFIEAFSKRKNGQIFPVEVSTRLIELGEEQLVFAHLRDITKRKKAAMKLEAERQRFFTVLDEMPAFIYLEAPDHSVRFANRYFIERFGDYEGKKCYELLKGIKEPCEECPALKVFEKRQAQEWESGEFRDGSIYQIYDYPFTDVDGSFLVLELGIDITKRKQAESEMRRLSSRILNTQEEERRRIAFELHDDLGQDLTVLKLHIDSILRKLSKDEQRIVNAFENVRKEVSNTIEKIRRISRDLSPSVLVDLGLNAALRWMLESFAKHSEIKISKNIIDLKNLFSGDQEINIYRIFQEILTNIGKHARASWISVRVTKDTDQVFFRIEDNGAGFDINEVNNRYAPEKGLGLAAMDERVKMLEGQFDIVSRMGVGTTINFAIPIDNPPLSDTTK